MSVGYQNGDHQKRASGSGDWEQIKDDVTGAASEAAAAATDRGREFIASARDQAAGYVDRRKDSAAQSVEDIASSLRESGSAFDDRPNVKAFVDSAAEGLESLAEEIRDRSFAELYADVEEFARRRPTAFAAAAGIAGFMLARFLKSSADDAEYRRQEASRARSDRMNRQRQRADDGRAGQRGA